MNSLWNELADAAGLTLSAQQGENLSRYLDLLLAANERMNLTRISDRTAAEVQHVGDALTLLPFLPAGEFRLADVGSGGGVPGIPLAIVRPNAGVWLIESTKKKAAFLEETARSLGMGNVHVLAERAEVVGRSRPLRASFDVVTARALAAMDELVQWCLPLVKPGGKLLAMKGPKVVEELPAAARTIKRLGGAEPRVHAVKLPEAQGHVVVEIGRKRSTSE